MTATVRRYKDTFLGDRYRVDCPKHGPIASKNDREMATRIARAHDLECEAT